MNFISELYRNCSALMSLRYAMQQHSINAFIDYLERSCQIGNGFLPLTDDGRANLFKSQRAVESH